MSKLLDSQNARPSVGRCQGRLAFSPFRGVSKSQGCCSPQTDFEATMAIMRNQLQCLSCGAKTITRTAPGLAAVQEYKFPCPGCDVEIRFALLRRKGTKLGYSYRKPVNAKWVSSEAGAIKTLTFDSFRLAPKEMTNVFSPFMAEALKISPNAYKAYAREEAMRVGWIESQWPWIQRLMVHFDNRNKSLFDKEAKLETDSANAKNWATRMRLFYRAMEGVFDLFTFTRLPQMQRVRQRIALAQAIPGNIFHRLVQDYNGTSRMSKMWAELNRIRSEFLANYKYLSAVLRTLYWTTPPQDLADYDVPEKRFDELKQLYINCFETLCRLTVIAIAIEAIIHHKTLSLPTKKGHMSLWDYEAMPNGNKPSQLAGYPIQHLFIPVMDNDLRNGIGHYSAVYDAKADEVVYHKYKGKKLVQVRLPYTEFAFKVLQIYSALELAALYFHALHMEACEAE